MIHELVIPQSLPDKLNSVSSDVGVKRAWARIGVSDTNDMLNKIVKSLNVTYSKLNIENCIVKDRQDIKQDVDGCTRVSDFLGYIQKKDTKTIVAYFFWLPPNYSTRSGVLAQQVIPSLSGVMSYLNEAQTKDFNISNRPIYIVNLNEQAMTPAIATNIISADIIGFRYLDIYSRDVYSIVRSAGIVSKVTTLEEYNKLVEETSSDSKSNEIFNIDTAAKVLKFLKLRLKDGKNVNNEPYWFCLKAYAAFYLAQKEKYTIDMSEINTLRKGNPTLDAFREYVDKF